MAKVFILDQPRGNSLPAQLGELLEVVDAFESTPIDEEVVISFENIRFVHPLFILTLSAAIYHYREKGYSLYISNIDRSKCQYYLDNIRFPKGLQPDKLKTWERIMNYYRRRNYLPIINFSTATSKQESVIRDNVLSKLNQLVMNNLNLSSGYYDAILYLLSEITDNIVEHAVVNRGWVIAQYYPNTEYLDICILDTGISILGSYQQNKNEKITDDLQAVQSALEGVSTKGEGRGAGIRTSKNMIINGLNEIL